MGGSLESHEVQEGRGDVSETGLIKPILEVDAVGETSATDDDRDRGQGVRCERHGFAVVILERLQGLFRALHHVVGIAMVGSDQKAPLDLVHDVEELLEACIHELAAADGGREVAGVAYHIGVGEIDADLVVFARSQRLLAGRGDLPGLHVRLLIERANIRRDLEVRLELIVKVARAVAVPEEGDVPKLLCLGAHKRPQTVLGQELSGDARDSRRRHQIVRRKLSMARGGREKR